MLNDLACKSAIKRAVQGGKVSKHFDSKGLYLLCKPNGSALWRYKYRIHGKEKLLALGVYPLIGLSEARERHQLVYRAVMDGHDPSQQRQAQKLKARLDAAASFEALSLQWHQHNLEKWKASHAKNILRRLQKNLFPVFGRLPAKDLTRRLLLDILQQVERRGAPSMARMLLNYVTGILRYGVLHDVVPYNIALDLKGALKPRKAGHFPSMEIEQLPVFLQRFYGGEIKLSQDTRDAIELLMLTLVRRGELIAAEWSEIDFDKALWTVPAVRMKMQRDHLVPLSKQAVAILQRRRSEQALRVELRGNRFVFPGVKNPDAPMCPDRFSEAFEALGFKDVHSAHGFRALGMGIAKEKLGYRHEVPDRQLAHAPASSVDRAYDRAKFLPERTEMMQKLANYIESQNPHITNRKWEMTSLKTLPITAPPFARVTGFPSGYQVRISFG